MRGNGRPLHRCEATCPGVHPAGAGRGREAAGREAAGRSPGRGADQADGPVTTSQRLSSRRERSMGSPTDTAPGATW
jgi:hypothetical protein